MPTASFLLIFRDAPPHVYRALSPEERQQLMSRWNQWYEQLAFSGIVQHGHPLEPEGRIVSSRGDRIVDGPYAEAKEAIGGYFFLRAANLEAATDIAKQCPSLRIGLTVEVRPVAETCHLTGACGGDAKQN